MSTELLKKVYLFKGLGMAELVAVLKICRQERFPAGNIIFLEGEAGQKCYIIESGQVNIKKYVPNVGEETLAILEAGSLFGEMSLIDGSPRSAAAAAEVDTTCMVIKKTDLDALIDSNKDLGNKILLSFCRTLSGRLRDTNERISQYLAMSAGFGDPAL